MKRTELNNMIYEFVCPITEGSEHNGSYRGNGHHLAQRISKVVEDKLFPLLEQSQPEQEEKELQWHKYPNEIPTDINNKWVTIKDGTTDISWYNNKRSQVENLHWDGFFDGDIIAWAEIKYPQSFLKEH